jgi:hypothetical protein
LEAVVNSIHSIQTLGINDGWIHIRVERDEAQGELDIKDTDHRPIVGFVIEDNGVGFDDVNYDSFTTSDTKFKPGAKGIGRFMWLKAFDSVHVSSVYGSNGSQYERTFDFLLTPEGVENLSLEEVKGKERKTVVHLKQYKIKYQDHCPKGIETIADKIIEHCLIYFLTSRCPIITIEDSAEKLVLNDLYNNNVKGKTTSVTFKIKGRKFNIINLRLYLSDEKKHQAHYCANERVVKSMNVGYRIPEHKLVDSINY